MVASRGEPSKHGGPARKVFLCEPEPRDRPTAPCRGTRPGESAAAGQERTAAVVSATKTWRQR